MNNYIELIHKMDFKSTATRSQLVMDFLINDEQVRFNL